MNDENAEAAGALARYRQPSRWRSALEILITVGPFVTLWIYLIGARRRRL